MTGIGKHRTVAVAGATGLAGSSVVRRLLRSDPQVRIRAGYRSRSGWFLEDPRVDYVQGDVRDPADCLRLFQGCQQAVLTAASTGGAAAAAAAPWAQVTDNLIMDSSLLQALHDAGVRRAVYVGSATAYQDCTGAVAEADLDWAADPVPSQFGIGWAKRSAEKLCQFWHQATGIELIVARAANIYGPAAKFDPRQANFIPALIRKAVDAMDPFEVWGRPDVVRDVLYADDFADGVLALLRAEDIAFDIFNLGSGRGVSVGEVATAILRVSGHQPSAVQWIGDAPMTVQARILNCDKIAAATGWRAGTSLEDGLRETLDWWKREQKQWTR